MESRLWPSTFPATSMRPSSSGPLCTTRDSIRETVSESMPPYPPIIPHISLRSDPGSGRSIDVAPRMGCVSPYPLAPALFGVPFFGFYGRTPPQVPPDATADQEEGEPRCRGHEHLDDLLDPIRLPKRRDGEREDDDRAQSGEDRGHRHHANPHHQAQAPRTQLAPLIAGWGMINLPQPALVSISAFC